jgi:hypothetical protein
MHTRGNRQRRCQHRRGCARRRVRASPSPASAAARPTTSKATERGEAIVVMSNSEGAMEIAADIVRSRFGDLPLLIFPMMYPPD